jgi:hypothetical protein
MRPDDYRRRAILAQERAAQTTDPRIKEWWEDAARNWFFVAQHVEWLLESVLRSPDSTRGQPQPVQQQHQVQPDEKELDRYWVNIRAELKKKIR